MARRSGGSHKCVEEKRRMLPIYQHYTLSPGRTKSHHPEAKCIHCLKEFVCGSKQRLIRHLRKCNSITNPEQIIAETLNTLARNSPTGQLNHSILEASNLLPSQISHIHHSTANPQIVGHTMQQNQHQYNPHHSHHQQHHSNNLSSISSSNSTTLTTANSNLTSNNSTINNGSNDSTITGSVNHNVSGSSLTNNDSIIVATPNTSTAVAATFNGIIPVKKTRRGRRPTNQHGVGSGIHVTTGLDGKTQFTPISQLPPGVVANSTQLVTSVHGGEPRGSRVYTTYHQANSVGSLASNVVTSATASSVVPPGATINSGHIHISPFKLNSELIDKAYLKLVLTRNLPLSLCDTREFQNWVKTFANDYKPPSSINLIAQNLKQEAHSARQRISNILVKAPKKTINLELQCWPDKLRGHLWYAMIAAPDTRRFLISTRDLVGKLSNNISSAINNHLSGSDSDINIYQSSNDAQQTDHKTLSVFIDDCIKRVGSDRVNSLMFTSKMTNELDIEAQARQALYSNHPSIVTYDCWWHFTNQLSRDLIENDEGFRTVLINSGRLINFINKRPQLYLKLERFSPFAGSTGMLNIKRDDPRWYSHLAHYLFEFIKNNHEAIVKALGDYHPKVESTLLLSTISDNNNNNPTSGSVSTAVPHNNGEDIASTQQKPSSIQSETTHLIEVRSIVTTPDYWTNLDSALIYMKPFRDIVALIASSSHTAVTDSTDQAPITPAISTTLSNHLSLSEYMHWFLSYGKSLFDLWRQSPTRYRHMVVGQYINRFNASIENFKLLFAAYLLNPKYRCAYVAQRAKDMAIEEILNIASEFMPEESDGHTIFDQWKLYLVREEPYDMVFDEGKSSALDWWMSLPCAESIRRVALRILRMKAFSSPKPESLFSQLYLYEDETSSSLGSSSFDDLAVLRFFYDHEDRHGVSIPPCAMINSNLNSPSCNGFVERSHIGQAHNGLLQDTNDTSRYLPPGRLNESSLEASSEQFANGSLSISEGGELKMLTDCAGDYMDSRVSDLGLVNTELSLESLPGYDQYTMYIDFNEIGIQVVEEPIEKKRRKWTAQEILSKCQTNHNHSSGVSNANSSISNNNTANNKVGEK